VNTFQAQLHQNAYLPEGESNINAIVSVTCSGAEVDEDKPEGQTGANLALGLLIDCSGSMGQNGKLHSAKAALNQIIDLLPETALFFIVAGNACAEVIHACTPASASNKTKARAAVRRLDASGGTTISKWLREALGEFPGAGNCTRQAILLTDGDNQEGEEELLKAVKECQGRFQCEARGVGTDWKPGQLRKIADGLLGTADIIAKPAEIAADFQSILKNAVGKQVAEAVIRLWTPQGSETLFVKQVSPSILDLSKLGVSQPQNALVKDYPTGAWGNETRDYHLAIRVKPGGVGQKMLAGRASLVTKGNGAETVVTEAKILAIWSCEEAQTAIINSQVAHYTGQGELAQAIQEGLAARQAGNEQEATVKLGRAARLAAETGNEATTKLLRNVVEIVDAREGTVKLRRDVSTEDVMTLDTRSTKTTRIRPTA